LVKMLKNKKAQVIKISQTFFKDRNIFKHLFIKLNIC